MMKLVELIHELEKQRKQVGDDVHVVVYIEDVYHYPEIIGYNNETGDVTLE